MESDSKEKLVKKKKKKGMFPDDRAYLVAQRVKRLPAMQETWVQPLGREDPLEKEMATCFSTLAWKIPRTEEPGRLQSGSQRVADDRATSLLTPPIIMSILHSGSRLLLM